MLRRLTGSFAAGLAALALAAPAAVAMPDYPLPSGPDGTGVPAAQVAEQPETIRVPGPTVVVEADDSGFDWGSAAIGAGIALGIGLLAAAGAMTATRHGHTRPTS